MRKHSDTVPIFFIHSGNQEYLGYTIKQAEKNNKTVCLLGDSSNRNRSNYWVNMQDYITEDYEKFKTIYLHMSSNPYEFELNCFRRFFVSYEFAKQNEIERFLMLDSDLLAFVNFSKLDFSNYIAGFSIPKNQDHYNWTASPHCSYWTLEGIKCFLDFLTDKYTNGIDQLKSKWNYHKDNKIKGGICDMTLLYLWSLSQEKNKILNTARIYDGTVFDHFLSVSEGYEIGAFLVRKFCNIKHLKFDEGKAYFKTKDGQWVKTYTIHAQGKSKIYIPVLYGQKNAAIYYDLTKIKEYAKRTIKKVKNII